MPSQLPILERFNVVVHDLRLPYPHVSSLQIHDIMSVHELQVLQSYQNVVEWRPFRLIVEVEETVYLVYVVINEEVRHPLEITILHYHLRNKSERVVCWLSLKHSIAVNPTQYAVPQHQVTVAPLQHIPSERVIPLNPLNVQAVTTAPLRKKVIPIILTKKLNYRIH